jgi:integrase
LHWLESIVAPPAITQNAHDAYEVAVRVHLAVLREHREEQERERLAACDLWEDTGFVLTTRAVAVNPSTDYHAWKRLLARAGVLERRLHDARHTAATVLCCSACRTADRHVTRVMWGGRARQWLLGTGT